MRTAQWQPRATSAALRWCSHRFASSSRRIRQHANPFAPELWAAPAVLRFSPPDCAPSFALHTAFADASAPLHIEVGCAGGEWLAAVAASAPGSNHLGIELRRDLAARASAVLLAAAPRNAAALHANPKLSWHHVFTTPGCAQRVSLLHPDPCWKNAHAKRRFLDRDGLALCAWWLAPGGVLALQTDVAPLARWMEAQLASRDGRAWFARVADAELQAPPPWGRLIATPREARVAAAGGAIHRAAYTRTAAPCAPPPTVPAPSAGGLTRGGDASSRDS